jgi:hypothetical protein
MHTPFEAQLEQFSSPLGLAVSRFTFGGLYSGFPVHNAFVACLEHFVFECWHITVFGIFPC